MGEHLTSLKKVRNCPGGALAESSRAVVVFQEEWDPRQRFPSLPKTRGQKNASTGENHPKAQSGCGLGRRGTLAQRDLVQGAAHPPYDGVLPKENVTPAFQQMDQINQGFMRIILFLSLNQNILCRKVHWGEKKQEAIEHVRYEVR